MGGEQRGASRRRARGRGEDGRPIGEGWESRAPLHPGRAARRPRPPSVPPRLFRTNVRLGDVRRERAGTTGRTRTRHGMNKQSAEEPHGRPFSLVGTVVASVTMLRYISRRQSGDHPPSDRPPNDTAPAAEERHPSERQALPPGGPCLPRARSSGAGTAGGRQGTPRLSARRPRYRAPAASPRQVPRELDFANYCRAVCTGTLSISVRVSSSSRRPVDNDDDVVVPRAGGTTVAREIPPAIMHVLVRARRRWKDAVPSARSAARRRRRLDPPLHPLPGWNTSSMVYGMVWYPLYLRSHHLRRRSGVRVARPGKRRLGEGEGG